MGLLSNLFKSLSEGRQSVPEGQNRPLSLIYAASWSHIGQEGQGVTGGTKCSKGSSCDPSREWLWSQWAASGQQLPGSYLPKVPARNCPLRDLQMKILVSPLLSSAFPETLGKWAGRVR